MNVHGERRSNETHQSATDPEAKLARKGAGKEARLCYSGNALMENRNSILLDFQVEPADGHAENMFTRAERLVYRHGIANCRASALLLPR